MKNAGFSILEVLISVTILSFIMMGVISVTGDSTTTKERVIAEDKENLQIEMAFARFDWDFTQIYSPAYFSNKFEKPFTPPGQSTNDESKKSYDVVMSRFSTNKRFPFPNQDGLPIPKFSSDKSTFIFFTTSNRRKIENSKESHFGWVKYAIETPKDRQDEDKKGDNLVRYFLAGDPFGKDELNWDDVKGHVLMEGITSFKISFWDREKRDFVDSLNLLPDGENKIWGVKMTIGWIDASEIEREDIRVFRPLWPFFKPEDLNKLAQQEYSKQQKANTPKNVPKTPTSN